VPDMPEHTVATERWLPVPDFQGYYEVSDRGRVRSLYRVVMRSNGVQQTVHARILRPSPGAYGHCYVPLARTGTRAKRFLVHRLILMAFKGSPPDGTEACHNNGNAEDNRLENLRWGTPSSNNYDRTTHRTNPCVLREQCPFEHDLVEPNLVKSKSSQGHRSCRACQSAHNVAYRRRKKGLETDRRVVADVRYRKIMNL